MSKKPWICLACGQPRRLHRCKLCHVLRCRPCLDAHIEKCRLRDWVAIERGEKRR